MVPGTWEFHNLSANKAMSCGHSEHLAMVAHAKHGLADDLSTWGSGSRRWFFRHPDPRLFKALKVQSSTHLSFLSQQWSHAFESTLHSFFWKLQRACQRWKHEAQWDGNTVGATILLNKPQIPRYLISSYKLRFSFSFFINKFIGLLVPRTPPMVLLPLKENSKLVASQKCLSCFKETKWQAPGDFFSGPMCIPFSLPHESFCIHY